MELYISLSKECVKRYFTREDKIKNTAFVVGCCFSLCLNASIQFSPIRLTGILRYLLEIKYGRMRRTYSMNDSGDSIPHLQIKKHSKMTFDVLQQF